MIEVWSEPASTDAEVYMPQQILTRLRGHVQKHPWWQARARLIARLIKNHGGPNPQNILDVGCGWGVTLEYLESLGHEVTGLDVGRESLAMLDRANRRLILGDIQNGPISASDRGKFDVVLALDVLEHLSDDRSAMDHLAELVRPGGLVIVTVPALPELWSEFDAIQGHQKRYEKHELLDLVSRDTELERVQVHFCWPWLIWPARLSRSRNTNQKKNLERKPWEIYELYVRPPIRPIRWLMTAMFRISENAIIQGRNRSGTSLLAYGFRKT